MATHRSTPIQGRKRLLEHLECDPVVVYGISAGGPTAITLAARHPRWVEKLILVSAVTMQWLLPDDPIYQQGQKVFNEKTVWRLVRFLTRLAPTFLAQVFVRQLSTQPPAKFERQEIRDLMTALRRYRSGKGFLHDLDQELHPAMLEKISCPVLLIHSQFDHSVSPEHARHAHQHLKNSQLVWLNNPWGHMVWIGPSQPDLSDTIAQFL